MPAEAQKAFDEVCAEEKQFLANGDREEKTAVKSLIEIRSRKDWRASRLGDANKKLVLQRDLVMYDVAEPLHHKFISCANNLLVAKEAEISKLLAELLPPSSGLRISIDELTRASAPVTKYRQVANFIRNELPADQDEHLLALRDLPSRWMRSLVELS